MSKITIEELDNSLRGNINKIEQMDEEIASNKTSILELQTELNGQRLRGINIANTIIDKLEG